MFFGLVNAAVALWTLYLFRDAIKWRSLTAAAVGVMALLVGGMFGADRVLNIAESGLYADDVILSRTTPYQRIVVTAWRNDLRLFLNSHLQFSSRDEYRYHEALVHPGLAAMDGRRVLVLGGGDGLALREILKYPRLEHVTLVDLDPEMPRLFGQHPQLTALNGGAFRDPRVRVISADAMAWLQQADDIFARWSTCPTRRTSRWASCTRRCSIVCSAGGSPMGVPSLSRARHRSSRGSPSGVSSVRSRTPASRPRRITSTCRRSVSGGSCSGPDPRIASPIGFPTGCAF
jgi:hypothetical protein